MRLGSPPTCQLRQGGTNDVVNQQLKELKMKNKTCPIHDFEYIPCIVDVTGFTNSLDYPRTKSFPISWHMNCPYCEKDYYESVYAEWGTYFI